MVNELLSVSVVEPVRRTLEAAGVEFRRRSCPRTRQGSGTEIIGTVPARRRRSRPCAAPMRSYASCDEHDDRFKILKGEGLRPLRWRY
jgi:hypothetical protein